MLKHLFASGCRGSPVNHGPEFIVSLVTDTGFLHILSAGIAPKGDRRD
ncbi:hypothetical protein B9G69_007915 [Bdellovibrio sp. SKB1291214]|nr:hypothetical protein [Bdellovibrio sp. SKB1291214]UYL10499.1 hypothetical protein B9G69_007915 [Bdellovibrio sp. SKB1291214]